MQGEEETITETYEHLIKANSEAAEKLIPPKGKSKKKLTAKDPRIIAARERMNKASFTYQKDSTEPNRLNLQDEKSNFQKAYNQVMEEDLDQMIREVEDADTRGKHRLSWNLINSISGRKASKKGIITGKSQEDRVNHWYTHFSQLLGNKPHIEDEDEEIATVLKHLNIKEGPFSKDEYETVKKRLKEGKSAGQDGIPPEVLKRCDLDDVILDYANKLLLNSQKPDQLSEINIITLPKSGDLSKTCNYRGISLSSIVAKFINSLILIAFKQKSMITCDQTKTASDHVVPLHHTSWLYAD